MIEKEMGKYISIEYVPLLKKRKKKGDIYSWATGRT